MKILILGGSGMLGHQFLSAWQHSHDVKVTLRNLPSDYASGLFNPDNSFAGIDVSSPEALDPVLEKFRPDAVVNAIGVTKQRADGTSVVPTIEINALFPHQLALLCARYEARLVHMSTDCIFSGKTGFYDEQAVSDAKDLYGRSKFLGEIDQSHVVTLRKSTIGLELAGAHGLVEWFLSQRGEIKGFRKAIYSGLVSTELASVIEDILVNQPALNGVWNVASEPINKYDLLVQLSGRMGRTDIEIKPDDSFVCNRSLNGAAFQRQTGYIAPSWGMMLDALTDQIKERDRNHVR